MMATTTTIASMKLSGGAPALDFVNTVDARRDRWGPDLLVTFDDLITWAERVTLIDSDIAQKLTKLAGRKRTAAALSLENAKVLREATYRTFLCEAKETVPSQSDVALLGRCAADASGHRELRRTVGAFAWDWDVQLDLETISHRVAFEVANLLADRDRRRVRECTGPNCGWLFVDTSKGGRRRWCSDETCGAHSRVLRYRRKQ